MAHNLPPQRKDIQHDLVALTQSDIHLTVVLPILVLVEDLA